MDHVITPDRTHLTMDHVITPDITHLTMDHVLTPDTPQLAMDHITFVHFNQQIMEYHLSSGHISQLDREYR